MNHQTFEAAFSPATTSTPGSTTGRRSTQTTKSASVSGAGSTQAPVPTLDRRPDGRLWLEWKDVACAVRIARCFPWSSPSRFISLRDDDRQEVLLVEDPAELDDCSREILEDALIEADFVFDICRVDAVDEEIEIRCWQVETRQGSRSFQTQRDDWPRIVPGGGLLIRDVAGDLYLIREPTTLDKSSRERIAVFVD